MVQAEIVVATSIPPIELDLHSRAISSWAEAGFNIVSVNTYNEICQLEKHFPNVTFIETTRTGQPIFQKPLIYLDDILSTLDSMNTRYCGICNADIFFMRHTRLAEFIRNQVEDSILFGSRNDVDCLEDDACNLYFNGRDYFFFERSLIPAFVGTEFCLGAPWWDIWFPLAAMNAGVRLKQVKEGIAKHVRHATRWDPHYCWEKCAELFLKYAQRDAFEIEKQAGYVEHMHNMLCYGKNPEFADFVTDYLVSVTEWISFDEASAINVNMTATPESYTHEPLVSAIVSTFNSEFFLRGCLEDLTTQTLFAKNQLEIIVIDSASEQNEMSVVKAFRERYGNKVIYMRTKTRESIYQAWNRGIRAASGRYITSANTDDRHRFDALEQMAAVLDAHPDVALVYADVFVTNFPNQTFEHHIRCGYQLRPDYSPAIMLSGCHMGPQPMWRRDVHREVGFFSENLVSAGDYEFWCRIASHHRLLHIPQFLGLYFENPQGFANSDTGLSRRETLEIQRVYATSFPQPVRDYLMSIQYWGEVVEDAYVNICITTHNSMPGLGDRLEKLIRYTEYPHVVTVVDIHSSDGTREFLQAMKRGGIITNLVLLDENAASAKALDMARNCEPSTNHHVSLEDCEDRVVPGWLTDDVTRTHNLPHVDTWATLDSQKNSVCHKKPSLLFVMYGWKETGGGTMFPRSVALALTQRGYCVSVLYASLENDPTLPPYSLIHDVEGSIQLYGMINRPASFNDPDNPQREIDDPAVRGAFCHVLDEVKPDLVHFHNFHGLTFSIAEEVCRRKIPSCFTPHNYHLIDPELYLLKNGLVRWDDVNPLAESEAVSRNPHLREWYLKRIETAHRLVNEWLGITLAVSQRQRELLSRFGALSERIAVVHQSSPAADRLWADPSIAAERLRRIQRPLQVGYIGGVIPIKGLQLLVAAAQSFTPEELQVHLYGLSDPHFEAELRASDLRGGVLFHGAYQHGDLALIAQSLDIAVIPSIVEESAPTLVLAELFAMRIPVIASRTGGIPEFINEGVDGELYPTYDLEALIKLLRNLVEDPQHLETMRRNLVAPTQTFARYMEHIEKVYAILMSGETVEASHLNLIAAKRQAAGAADLPGIFWQGGLFANNSLAHVNRELCLQLSSKGYPISFVPTEPDDFAPSADPRFSRLEALRGLPLERVDITLRHQWPPDFSPPVSGHWIMIQPWEFGSSPKEWVTNVNTLVDELWVPSTFVRDCYIVSGMDGERVHVVPNGVDTGRFAPDAPPLALSTAKRFRFLFVGGTIHRKGIDILLGAYWQAFRSSDDVCLVIKDMGGGSVYEGRTAQEVIERFRQSPDAPEIEYLDCDLGPAEMAGLYTACQCLVHPYRGEGFGLPIAEGMACGLPPIVTGYGAALDFCPPEIAWLIPATIEKLAAKQVGNRETVDYPWLAEPDFDALVSLMKYAAEHPQEVADRGVAACRYIHKNFSWRHAADCADERLRALINKPIKRYEKCKIHKPEISTISPEETIIRKKLVSEACSKARTLTLRGEIDSAVAVMLNQGIKADPSSWIPYIELAEILIAAGRHEDALQVLSEMPPATDQSLKHEIEALCHAALGDEAAVARASELALSDGGKRPRVLVVLGTLAARRGELAKAETLFRQAIDIDPSCAGGWLSLGMLLWGRGGQEEAWQAIRNAAIADPLSGETIPIYRDLAARLDRSDDAAKVIGEASKIHPDSIALARSHAEILGECGHDSEALEACESFLTRFGTEDGILKRALSLRERIGVYDRLAAGGGESVSLCMIVRNEEKNLAACLASVKPAVHEIIIVDTGSGDRTIEIATAFGARVFAFPWNGNFSDGRNHALGQAIGDWILVLDADERVSQQDQESIRRIVCSSAGMNEAWSVVTRNYTTRVNAQGWTANDGAYPAEEMGDGWYPSWKVRLFPNRPEIRFSGDVHEMVESSLRQNGLAIHKAPFVVHHYSGLSLDGQQDKEKQVRYFEIGLKKLEQDPDALIALTELAVQAGELGLFVKALGLWERVLTIQPECLEAHFNKSYALMGLRRYEEALASSKRALELDPAHKEAAFNYGTCELYVGDPDRALATLRPLAARYPDYPLLQAVLAVLFLGGGHIDEAAEQVMALKKRNYAVDAYIGERIAAVDALGRIEIADRIRRHTVAMVGDSTWKRPTGN